MPRPGLPVSGTKAVLIERILAAVRAGGARGRGGRGRRGDRRRRRRAPGGARGHGAARAEGGSAPASSASWAHERRQIHNHERWLGEDPRDDVKAQTTRHRILGVVTADAYQLVLSDTPVSSAAGLRAEPLVAAKAAAPTPSASSSSRTSFKMKTK